MSTRRGFSLVEVTLSLLIVGGMTIAVLSGLGSVARERELRREARLVAELTNEIREHIASLPFEDPDSASRVFGPEGDDDPGRAGFDDADDYRGWTETTITRIDGTTRSGCEGWSRAVTLKGLDPDDGSIVLADRTLLQARIRVTTARGAIHDVYTMKARHGVVAKAPYDRAIRASIELRVGTAHELRETIPLPNEPELSP